MSKLSTLSIGVISIDQHGHGTLGVPGVPGVPVVTGEDQQHAQELADQAVGLRGPNGVNVQIVPAKRALSDLVAARDQITAEIDKQGLTGVVRGVGPVAPDHPNCR